MRATSRKYSEAEWPLRLGYSPFVNHELIQEALVGYREIVPEGQIHSPSDCTAKLIEMLGDGRLDAAVVTLPISAHGFIEHRICEERFLVCLRSDDRFASGAEIPKEAIAEKLRILFNRDYHPALYDQLLRRFKRAGIELQPTKTYSAPAEMQFLVKARRCFGLVREHVPLEPELTARPITGMELRVATALIYRRDHQRPVFPMLAYRMTQRYAAKEGPGNWKRSSVRDSGAELLGSKTAAS